MKEETTRWNNDINERIRVLQETNQQTIARRDDLNRDITVTKRRMAEQDSIRSIQSMRQNSMNEDYRQEQMNANRFIRDYQILSNTVIEKNEDGSLKYPTELFFYWLIRMIFFLIELLPTLVKVITPVGVYDRLVYEEEKTLSNYFSSEEYHDALLAQQKAKTQYEAEMSQQRQNIEGNAHLEILKRASEAQNEVANEAIKKWKQKELGKLDTKVPEPTPTTTEDIE